MMIMNKTNTEKHDFTKGNAYTSGVIRRQEVSRKNFFFPFTPAFPVFLKTPFDDLSCTVKSV